MRNKLLTTALFGLLLPSLPAFGQKVVREENWFGNRYFKWGKMTDAEVHYRKALEANPKDPATLYNLSNLLYRTDRGEENGKLMQTLYSMVKNLPADKAADVAHNAGNSALRRKDYEHAVEFFKESLRHRPTDDETRYNLALAQKLLEKQQQEQQDQKQDQKQDQQQQQQDQDQQQNQNQDKPQEQNKQDTKDQMSRQAAEQILKSFLQDEKKTQKKVEQAQQQKGTGGNKREKNW